MGEDSLMVKKQAEISSNKCQLKQWDVRSAYYSAWKAYFSTCFLSYSMTGYGIACYFLISMGDQEACAGSWASSLQFFPGFALHGPSWLKVPPWASATSAWAAAGSFFQPPVRAALSCPKCACMSPRTGEKALAISSVADMCHINVYLSSYSHRDISPIWQLSSAMAVIRHYSERDKNCRDKHHHTKQLRQEAAFQSFIFPKVSALYRLRFNNILWWWVPQLTFDSFSPWWLTLLQHSSAFCGIPTGHG